jgi:hypothetical protein
VFNGDTATEKLVLEGLRRRLDGDVERKLVQQQTEAGGILVAAVIVTLAACCEVQFQCPVVS